MNSQMTDTCQPKDKWVDFHARKRCEDYVLKMQRRLDKAVRDGNVDRIRQITYLLSRCSEAVKIVAIERVTRINTGKYTAGVDGVVTPDKREEADKFRRNLLNTISFNKPPSPIRRVYIPKPNGKKRPLGIPTIEDRVIQDIHRIIIEPIAEYNFNDNSYGFRPKKSCQDAIRHIWDKTAMRSRPQWIIEGDIKGCFDHIDHNTIINKMAEWKIPKGIAESVGKMLKAGILSDEGYIDSDEGTPQGGILSPMLANIALTRLDDWGKALGKYNPIVRYADDFVVICKTKEEAERRRDEIKHLLKDEIGLELSDEKTRITNIHEGFNFLGFTIRKYRETSPYSKYHERGKILITPQAEKVRLSLQNCAATIKESRGLSLKSLIRKVNPKLKGFTNYYRFQASKETFAKISIEVKRKVYRWLCKSHPNKPRRWVWKRYSIEQNQTRETKTFRMHNEQLYLPVFMPIVRYLKVRSGVRVYDNSKEAREYWAKRENQNALNSIFSIRVEKLFKQQHGLCPICRKEMTGEQIRDNSLRQHHLNPQSKSDNQQLTNLRLIHLDCHIELHRILSLSEMSKLAKSRIDYCRKDYLYQTFV